MDILKEQWTGVIEEAVIGATKSEGGTRTSVVRIGGQNTLPFLFGEGKMPHKPVVAFEVLDIEPEWPAALKEPYKDVLKDPAKWAKKCESVYKAELICVSFEGIHPDNNDQTSVSDAVNIIKDIKQVVGVPLIITGCGDHDRDNEVLPKVSEALQGERCLIGEVIDKNYKTLTASVIADGHSIIAQSPIDVNIAKQTNIMINEMGLPLNRIIMNPTLGGLGYGIEYSYSIMERARLAALNGDKLLAMPFLLFVGAEAWKAKEAKADTAEFSSWGDPEKRGIAWEAVTAAAVLQSGGDVLVMRHPEAARSVREHIDSLMKKEE